MTPKSNQVNYEFIKKENGYVDLPVLMSASKYKVYDNGHIVNNIKQSKRGTLLLTNIKGHQKHKLQIKVQPSKTCLISIFTTVIGLVFVLIMLINPV